MRKKGTIALVAIAKNEARCIARMLASVRHFVDEMIVVDTGSEDNTVKIAKRNGAKIGHFKWRDDFSAARNYALSMTNATWRIILDADEWVTDGRHVLTTIRSLDPDFVGLVQMKNLLSAYTSLGWMKGESVDQVPRLLPRGVMYTGAIHEQPDRQGRLRLSTTDLSVSHDGYQYQHTMRKRGRNRSLLEKELQNTPNDPYLQFQYARELAIDGESSAALDNLKNALETVKDIDVLWRGKAVLTAMDVAAASRRFDEGFALAEQFQDAYAAWPDFWFRYSYFLEAVAHSHKHLAPALFIEMKNALTRCVALGDSLDLLGGMVGYGGDLAQARIAAIDEVLNQRSKQFSVTLNTGLHA